MHHQRLLWHWVIPSNNWFLCPRMRLVTLIHNLLPLLTTFLNHISMLILSSAFRSESKSALFILKQKHPASEPALLSRECSVQRQQTQNPQAAKAPFILLISYMHALQVPPSSQLAPWCWNRTTPKILKKGCSASKFSLTQTPMGVNKVCKACDQYRMGSLGGMRQPY